MMICFFLSNNLLSSISAPIIIHYSISSSGVQVDNHCPFIPPYLTWYLQRLFLYFRWYLGGAGPFDHGVIFFNLTSNILKSHSPAFSFDRYRHISTYYPILSYQPIFTGIVSHNVLSSCSMTRNVFSMTLSGIVIGKKSAVILHLVMFSF